MNSFTLPLCILKSRLFKERDIVLSALSQERGIFTLYAFGGAKSKRRFTGCLDTFTIALCTVQPSRKNGYLVLQEASLLHTFRQVLSDNKCYGMVQNCALFLQSSCRRGGLYTPGVYNLFYNVLQSFVNAESILLELPLFFRFALCALLGYKPILSSCLLCSCHMDFITLPFFSIEKGGLLCQSCLSSATAIPFQYRESLYVLQYILSFSPLYWHSIPYSRNSIQEACFFIDEYIQYHMGIIWSNNYFSYT